MRKLILFSLFLPAVLVFFSSCKKSSDSMTPFNPDQTVSVKIIPNHSYQLDLSNAGAVSISRQAIHFLVSEAIMSNENGTLVYKYTPAIDFTGNDEVVLLATKTATSSSADYSGGCPGSNTNSTTSTTTKYISLKIVVGN